MNALRFQSKRIPGVAVIVVTSLLAAVSGCSSHKEQREYAVPQFLCGIPVNHDKLAPFMPTGRKLTTKKDVPDSLSWTCQVRVDSHVAVEVRQMWLTSSSTAYFVGGQADSRLDHEAEGGRFLYSGWEAFGKTRRCTHGKLPGSHIFTAFQMRSSDHQDADAMRRLIIDYTEAVENTDVCKDGKSFA